MEKQIILTNRLSQLGKLSKELEILGNDWDIKPETMFNIGLLLDELFVIHHTGRPEEKSDAEIKIIFNDYGKEIKIRFITYGPAYNPICDKGVASRRQKKVAGERETGSLGISFVLKNVNSARYCREENMNIILMEKNY